MVLSQVCVVGDGVGLWVKPYGDTVKVTVDIAIFEGHLAFGMGMVAHDSNGNLIQEKAKHIKELHRLN